MIDQAHGRSLRIADTRCETRSEGGTWRLRLLQGFELSRDGEPFSPPAGTQRLVALLALENAIVERAQVAQHLWPDASEERARANLRTVLWRLSRVGCDVIAASDGRL